jgi:hypothetical protein
MAERITTGNQIGKKVNSSEVVGSINQESLMFR